MLTLVLFEWVRGLSALAGQIEARQVDALTRSLLACAFRGQLVPQAFTRFFLWIPHAFVGQHRQKLTLDCAGDSR
jgi:hypothetical protein